MIFSGRGHILYEFVEFKLFVRLRIKNGYGQDIYSILDKKTLTSINMKGFA